MGITRDLRQTRQKLQDGQTQFKKQLEEAKAALQNCGKELDALMAFKDSKTGLTEHELVTLIRSGLITGENIGSIISTSDEADRKALAYLGQGDYGKLFSIDPNSLQDSTYTLILAHIEKNMDSPAEMEAIINGLFGQNDMDAEARVETYLTKLSEQTMLQNTQLGMILMLDDSDPALKEQYNRMRQLDVLFETLYVVNPVKHTKGWEPTASQKEYGAHSLSWQDYGKIKNFSFTADGGVSFDLTTYRSVGGINANIDDSVISSVRYDGKYDFNEASENKRLADIRKAKDEYLLKIMESGLMTTVGIFQPELALAIGIIQSIKGEAKNSDKLKTAKDIDKLFDKGITEYGKNKYKGDQEGYKAWKDKYSKRKAAIGNVSTIASKIASLAEGWEALNADEIKERQNRLYSILDIGGTEVDNDGNTIYAEHTPIDQLSYEQQMRLAELSKRGYGSFFKSLSADEAEALKKMVENSAFPNEAQFVLSGGDPLKINTDRIEKVLLGAIQDLDDTVMSKERKRELSNLANDWFKSDGGYMSSFNK